MYSRKHSNDSLPEQAPPSERSRKSSRSSACGMTYVPTTQQTRCFWGPWRTTCWPRDAAASSAPSRPSSDNERRMRSVACSWRADIEEKENPTDEGLPQCGSECAGGLRQRPQILECIFSLTSQADPAFRNARGRATGGRKIRNAICRVEMSKSVVSYAVVITNRT